MTDERIKEEFDKWFRKMDATEEERSFSASVGCKSHDIGFYAGFRAAERLAKIEVLEEVLNYSTGRPGSLCIADVPGFNDWITNMLSDLKGEQ